MTTGIVTREVTYDSKPLPCGRWVGLLKDADGDVIHKTRPSYSRACALLDLTFYMRRLEGKANE